MEAGPSTGEGRESDPPVLDLSMEEGVLSDHVEVQHKKKGKKICSLTVQGGGKESSALGRVVIIQPEGTEEPRKKFMGSSTSIRVAKLLEESKFGRVGIKNVKSNFWKGTLSVEIDNME